jgi:hypothetical protein
MKQVLFWSKYSNNCKKILELMNAHNFNIENVCVDNKDIRSRILNDKRIKLSKVPTILALYDTGVIEKYEGNRAFDLFNNAFNEMQKKQKRIEKKLKKSEKPSLNQQTPPQPQQTPPQQTPPQHQNNGLTSLDDLVGDDLFSDQDERVNNKNLPVKTSSKIASIAADIAKSREVMDATLPKPTQNNIVPK